MYNSILQFIENDTKKIEKLVEKYLPEGNLLRFEDGLLDIILQMGRGLYQEILESIEQTIRDSGFRKQDYYVEHKEDRRTLLTRFGSIEVKRAYYVPKNGGKGVYLLDKYVGIDTNDKVSQAALSSALREAVESSYRKGGEEACLTSDVITKQTVKKLIHGLKVEMPEEIPEEKNNWLGIIVRYDDAGACWGCCAEGQVSHVLSARESSRPMDWSKRGADNISRLRIYTRNGGNINDLMEYRHKKEQEKKRIKKQDDMMKEIKKHHKLSGEESVRKEIPGLERKGMTWMRDLIYEQGA